MPLCAIKSELTAVIDVSCISDKNALPSALQITINSELQTAAIHTQGSEKQKQKTHRF